MGRVSVRTKILIVLLGCMLFFGLSMILFAETVIRSKIFAKIQEKGVALAKRTASDCINPVVTEQFFEVEMMFKDMMSSEKEIVYLFIMNKDQRVLAHTFAKGFPEELKTAHDVNMQEAYSARELTTSKGVVLDLGVPLLRGEAGILRMGLSEEPIRDDVNGIVMLITLFSFFIMLAGSVVAIVFSRLITRPILRLAHAAAAFGRGETIQEVIISSDDEIGALAEIFNTMVDKRKQSEERLLGSLEEKKVMLKEIHHRVKNNMQVIYSLLNLQAKGIADNAVRAMFEESRNRVGSMAMIHEKLYSSEDLAHIDFKEYLQGLVAGIAATYKRDDIEFSIDMEPVFLDVNVGIPCGLIVNELVSNSLKHAFPDGRKGMVKLGVSINKQGVYVMTISDNGIGFPREVDFRASPTLGLQLVNALVGQLRGTLELLKIEGTAFSITFPAK